MTDLHYQSSEWIEVQKEMYEDEKSKSIMDEFKTPPNMTKEDKIQKLKVAISIILNDTGAYKKIENAINNEIITTFEDMQELAEQMEDSIENFLNELF